MPNATNVQLLYEQAADLHRARFVREPMFAAAAPGRVNLIGEHTDYNDGFVFPMAIERHVVVTASAAQGASRALRVYSAAYDETVEVPIDAKPQRDVPNWSNYVRGVVAGWLDRGHGLLPLDVTIVNTVALGSGLSSSAALEVAMASLLESVVGAELSPIDKALLCQEAEHLYALVPCGLMDQLASIFGRDDHALFIDCRSREVTRVPFGALGVSILVCNTGVHHALASSEYAQRRSECHQAATRLGVTSLRDVNIDDLQLSRHRLSELHFRRARHVVTENHRVLEFVQALAENDLAYAGSLMLQSHASLRDDYQVSCKELDVLVAAAERLGAASGIYGARMTGGGFGGCAICMVRDAQLDRVASELTRLYQLATARHLEVFATRASEGRRWSSPNAIGSSRKAGDPRLG